MDAPGCDREELAEALRTLAALNRWLGNTRAVVRRTVRLLGATSPGRGVGAGARSNGTGRRPRLLDVGAGAGDIPQRLARQLGARGFRPRFVLADLHGGTLRISRRRIREGARLRGFEFVRLRATRLPFRSGAFDVALCSGTLHHLERAEAACLLRELHRVSRRGWLVTDLRRSAVAYGAVRLLAATVWRHRPMPRVDGPISVRRAFTPGEARALLEEAGLRGTAAVEAGLLRLVIRGRGDGGPDGRP